MATTLPVMSWRTRMGCESCDLAFINGVKCHEHGCPDAWKDYVGDCAECGCVFFPEARYQKVCGDCASDRCWEIQHPEDDDDGD